jgi:hypothetical protein
MSDRSKAGVELHIEELVLTGFAPADRFSIADAVERELTRLLGERGVQGFEQHSIAVERLDAGTFQVPPRARPQGIGGQIAEKVYGQIAPGAKKQAGPR